MNKDQKKLASMYLQILKENEMQIANPASNNQFQSDGTTKFLPIGQEKEDYLKLPDTKKSDKIKEKLKAGLTTLKSLIETCISEKCRLKDISNLIDLLNNPELKADLDNFKMEIQKENTEEGINARLAS